MQRDPPGTLNYPSGRVNDSRAIPGDLVGGIMGILLENYITHMFDHAQVIGIFLESIKSRSFRDTAGIEAMTSQREQFFSNK